MVHVILESHLGRALFGWRKKKWFSAHSSTLTSSRYFRTNKKNHLLPERETITWVRTQPGHRLKTQMVDRAIASRIRKTERKKKISSILLSPVESCLLQPHFIGSPRALMLCPLLAVLSLLPTP